MYLTAHLVRSPQGAEGINTFRHAHGPNYDWPDDPARLPDTDPGAIVGQNVSIPQGGNRVRSYLDVLAPDNVPREQVQGSLDLLGANLADQPNPTVFRVDPITLVFGHEFGLTPSRADVFMDLRAAVTALLDS